MKKIITMLVVCIAFIGRADLQAQAVECGTVLEKGGFEQYLQFRNIAMQNPAFSMQNGKYNVPVIYHIIRRSNGTGGANVADLDEALDTVNARYAPVDLQFYRCLEPNYIDNDGLFAIVKSDSMPTLNMISTNNNDNALNIYFCNYVVNADSSSLCGLANFPWNAGRWILMDNGCALNGSTLSHEIGHYFGLLHTHETSNGAEHVTRNSGDACYNCTTAGDGLCDTEADPELGSANLSASCNYTGTTLDTCTIPDPDIFTAYNPDPTNLMSYSLKECRDFFSPGQYAIILQSYLLTRRAQFDTTICTESICHTDISLPDGGGSGNVTAAKTIQAVNSISSTEKISGVGNPGVIYHAGKSVTLLPGFEVATGSRFEAYIEGCYIPSLKPAPPQQKWSNPNTQQSVNSSSNHFEMVCFPNPSDGNTSIQYTLREEQKVQINIFNSYGKVVDRWRAPQTIAPGVHQLNWDASHFKSGVYLAILSDEAGNRQVLKIVISKP